MKFFRYGQKGQEIPVMLDATGGIRDLSSHVADFSGDTVSINSLNKLAMLDPLSLPELPSGARIGCPLADVPNFFCIGLNYAKHAAETGGRLPPDPMIFNKATSALSGPYDPIPLPNGSTHTDWEVELGFVIGREASNVPEGEALNYISAYFAANDVSERDYQKNWGGQFVKGKSAPGFGPIGPWLVTPDEIPDPQNLAVKLSVNGEVQQDSNTCDMVFSVAQILSRMSHYMTLRVGDIVITGTPEGVGLGNTPPKFLKPGDVVELEVQGLGSQRSEVI
ncbi:MAG: fumarylacetoacetate hydrolase family protein [Rhodobacteraceae bacterium]|nr:fumarylacetoacetate hydrolase family protein [Paracoccaceae bacterium]